MAFISKDKKSATFGIASDATQMRALGEAVAASQARLALEEEKAGLAVQRSDPGRPPPMNLCVEGQELPPMCRGFAGYYERQPQREMEGGAPAYRHASNRVLWLSRDQEGCWRGQVEGKLGQLTSLLKLADTQCLFPCSETDMPWSAIDPSTRDWEKLWSLKCREAQADEVEAAKAALADPPSALMLELEGGGALPGGLASGFAGLYVRGQEHIPARMSASGEAEQKPREINGAPAWRHVLNPMLWVCRGPDGGWMGQGEASLGTPNAILRLRDTGALYPLGGGAGQAVGAPHSGAPSAVPWVVFDGKGWGEMARLRVRVATPAEVDACKPPTPPRHLFLSLAGGGEVEPVLPAAAEGGGAVGGAGGGGAAAEYAGLYELQEGHVNMQPAWRRVRSALGGACESQRIEGSLWLVRGRSGCWVGQKDSQLSRDAGALQLAHTGTRAPCDTQSLAVWQEYASGKWRDAPQLVCRVADEAEVAEMRLAATAIDADDAHVDSHVHSHGHEHGHSDGHTDGHADCCGHAHGHENEADDHSHGHEHGHSEERV